MHARSGVKTRFAILPGVAAAPINASLILFAEMAGFAVVVVAILRLAW
jgi:hypothetical protein